MYLIIQFVNITLSNSYVFQHRGTILSESTNKLIQAQDAKAGGDWSLSNSDLANKHTKWFQMFVNSINFDTLYLHRVSYQLW